MQDKIAIAEELAEAKSELAFLQQQQLDWQAALQEPGTALLTKALSHIKRNPRHALKTVSLQIQIPRRAEKPPLTPQDVFYSKKTFAAVLEVASSLFSLAMSSIRNSKIEIQDALDVFTADPASSHCSLPYDALARSLADDAKALAPCFSVLRALSIRFTDPAIAFGRSKEELNEMVYHHNVSAMISLLSLCSNLEYLKIFRYCLPVGPRGHQESVRSNFHISVLPREFEQLANSTILPSLRTLCLGGMRARAVDLFKIIHNHRKTLESVDLQQIDITEGELSTALEGVQSCINLKNVRLDKIYAPRAVLFGGHRMVHHRGVHAREPINYDIQIWMSRQRASLQLYREQMRTKALFG